MLAFVDESGDTGLKFALGSSRFFTILLVVFEENSEAQAADERITQLRRNLRLPASFEFHFVHNSAEVRCQFLKAIVPYNFFYFGYVLDKSQLQGVGLDQKTAFYKYACGLVFESAKPYLDEAVVRVDASGSQEFQGELSRYLRQKINAPKAERKRIRKVTPDESSRNNLLQLADMVCGAVARSIREQSAEAVSYRKIIKHREISVRVVPEKGFSE